MIVNELRVEDICDFVGGSQPEKSEFIYEAKPGYIRLIQTRDYKTDAFLTYIPENSTRKFCDEHDVMIGRYGPPIFQICRGLKGAYNVALMKAKPKKGIDREFLYYFLKQDSVLRYVEKLSPRTGGQTGVDLVSLNKYPVRVPKDIEDQRRVVASLVAIDKKIELNNRINTELEAMAKTLYDYWFVQFDFPDTNGQPYKTSGGKMVYNPTLKREIPEGWNDGRIGDIIGKAPQATKIPAKEFKENGKVPVIDQSQTYICGFTDDETGTIKPKPAHVIFGDHTRAVKLVNFDYARGADGTQVLVAKSEEVPSYLLYQIVSDIDLSSYGYARHYKFLKESKCVIPKADTSQLYQITVESWYEAIKNNVFQNYELQRLRDWLLPMLMNGQVTVK